jgi:hypothetical protein
MPRKPPSQSWRRRSPPVRCGWQRRRPGGCGWSRSSTNAEAGRASASTRAHWLAWQCGLGPGAAREHVRVARALCGLPRIAAAFAAGRLSYSKVRALSRIAEPDSEEGLLEFAASATASQTERFCRQWRRTEDETAGRSRPEEDLVFDYATDEQGFFTLRVHGRVEDGAPLMAAVDSLAERAARRERAQNTKAAAGHDQTRADGGTVDRDLVERCAEDAAVGLARERTAAAASPPSPRWPRPVSAWTAAPATRPGARWSCTSTRACWPTTPPPGALTMRAGRQSAASKPADCCARPRSSG